MAAGYPHVGRVRVFAKAEKKQASLAVKGLFGTLL
jgi:hypothetical protein